MSFVPETNESTSSEESDSDTLYVIQQNDSDENMQDTSYPTANNTFDLTLPATHSYLGNNLEEVRGRTILDNGIYMNLPLLVKQAIVLFPGQTLPMTIHGVETINMLQKCIETDRTFGVIYFTREKIVPIGTTAEIYQYKHEMESQALRVKAKGRQRFKMLRIIQGYGNVPVHGRLTANVQILPEISLGTPLFDERLVSLDRLRRAPTNIQGTQMQQNLERHDAIVTPWPSWVYKQYDSRKLSIRIREFLHYIASRGSNIPEDPIELSFWVAQNLPLNDNERIMLLKYNCAISRLQWQIKYLLKDRLFSCSHCDRFIGKQSNIFPMSKEGPQNAYCNPAGIIHETLTLYKARGLTLSREPPCTEYSWFPGYAWTVASCKGCGIHMGWQFTAVNADLKPESFWGVVRKSLRSKLPPQNENQDRDSTEVYSDSDDEFT